MIIAEPTTWILPAIGLGACALWPFRRTAKAPGSTGANLGAGEPGTTHRTASDENLDRGIRLGMLGHLERASESFRSAVEADPTSACAHYNLALALDLMGRQREAREHYQTATELRPDSFEAQVNFGVLLCMLGETGAAAERFRAAISVNPHDPTAYFNLGCCYLDEGEHRKAAEAFRDSVSADPADAMTRFNLAVALRRAGCADLAEAELRAFLELAGARYPEHRAYVQAVLADHYGG